MRVEESRISKACVSPYLGREIPRSRELGLDPQKTYFLLRDPKELERAADTFTGKPLLIRHVPITADLPSKELWVGTLGAVTWEAPYLLTRPLTVLTQEAIDLIESEAQRELSAGYRYDAEMVPGVYGGERYDGRMVNIHGNHVAIVSEGRVGPDVHVADESPPELRNMKHAAVIEKLKAQGLLAANLSAEQLLALDGELGEVPTSVGEDEDLDDDEKKKAEDAWREDKGMDASEELKEEDREMAYNKAKDRKAKDKRARDKKAKDAKRAKDAKDKAARDASSANIDGSEANAKDGETDHREDFNSEKESGADTVTKDELTAAVKAAAETTRKQMRESAVAREAVRPIVGVVPMAMDSADEIYAFALKQAGVECKGVHPSAYPTLLDLIVKRITPRRDETLGMDAATRELGDVDAIFCAPRSNARELNT